MNRLRLVFSVPLALAGLLAHTPAHADDVVLRVEYGPISGTANEVRSLTMNDAAQTERVLFDVQDGLEHRVRGVSLADLIKLLKLPKHADAIVFVFENGMQVPVKLADRAEVGELFIALQHGDGTRRFQSDYLIHQGDEKVPCPKVVYSRRVDGYTIWRFPNHLQALRVVTWSQHEATLAQPSRHPPTHPGWKLYAKHCQPCHGMGGQGAARGPDFISDLDAYRRIPPLSDTSPGDPPSLHEKVSGRVGGQMPTLSHIPKADILTLWRWLHAVHSGATK